MVGAVVRYVLRHTLLRYVSGPRHGLKGIRSQFSTTTKSLSEKSPKNHQNRPILSTKLQHDPLRSRVASEILHLRRLTDTINRDLSFPTEDLQAWIEQFLSLGSLRLLRDDDCTEVRDDESY